MDPTAPPPLDGSLDERLLRVERILCSAVALIPTKTLDAEELAVYERLVSELYDSLPPEAKPQ